MRTKVTRFLWFTPFSVKLQTFKIQRGIHLLLNKIPDKFESKLHDKDPQASYSWVFRQIKCISLSRFDETLHFDFPNPMPTPNPGYSLYHVSTFYIQIYVAF